MGNFSKNFLNFFSPDGSRIRFPLPGKRRETASRKRLFCISSISSGFDFPSGETKGNSIREAPFLHLFHPRWFRFPLPGKRRGATSEARQGPFFLQKGPSCKISHRDILQFTPENAPYGKEIPPSAEGDQGYSPWVFAAASVGALVVCHWHTAPSPG